MRVADTSRHVFYGMFTQDLDLRWHVYACGPKTVPVKRAFLNMSILGWGGGGC